MTITDATASFFPRTAITRAELAYQHRSSRQGRWRRWVGRIIMAFGITMSMILFWGEFAGAALGRDAGPIGDKLRIGAVGLLVLALVYHFVLMIQTLSFAANSIARERQNNTWDMLVLTGVDARQIVRGKWWATVQRQWHSYALLGLLRTGAVVWFSASNSRYLLYLMNSSYNSNYGSYSGYNYYGYSYISNITPPLPLGIIFVGAVIFTLTMVNLGFTAACGVLASAQIRRSALALGRSIALRLLTILSIFLLVLGLPALLGSLTHGAVTLWFSVPWMGDLVGRSLLTLLDNGTSVAGEFASFHYTYYNFSTPDSTGFAVLSIFVSVGVYLLLTRFLLGQAQRRTVREQALPPLEKLPQQIRKTALF
jgi:hypothetical protein